MMVAAVVGVETLAAKAADFTWLRTNTVAHVLIVQDSRAISAYQPNNDIVQALVDRGIIQFTGQTNLAASWRSLVSTNDVVGIKVYANAGAISGTRPAVVGGVIHGLIAAGIPRITS